MPRAPFGGIKTSGVERQDRRNSVEVDTELQWITIQLGQPRFPF
jgi:acyl-CoA reductase-like NAD-dependent aldehyde dehydrogenase